MGNRKSAADDSTSAKTGQMTKMKLYEYTQYKENSIKRDRNRIKKGRRKEHIKERRLGKENIAADEKSCTWLHGRYQKRENGISYFSSERFHQDKQQSKNRQKL